MTKDEFITKRTQIISDMLDNPDKHGIYPTTKAFNELDKLFDELEKQVKEIEEIRKAEYGRIHNKLKLAVFDGEEGKDAPTETLVNNLIVAYKGIEKGMEIIKSR